jgi:hypothetical protein
LEYSPHDPNVEHLNPTIFADEEVTAIFSKYKISTDGSFVPEKMEIRDATSRKRRANEDTRRIVALGKDQFRYKVFKYPAPPSHRASDENEDISMS